MIPLIYHQCYSELDLPQGHRYPINKYRLLHRWLCEEVERNSDWSKYYTWVTPKAIDKAYVEEVHCSNYVSQLLSGTLPEVKMRRIGFPWSRTLIERTLTSAGGTCETVKQAIKHGLAIHLSGGYHHAHHDFGSGFCLFNDLVLAAHQALKHEDIEKVLIVDVDVHHGDGTATLCHGRDDIVTLSVHCDKNFPARKPDSDMDIALSRNTSDEEYLSSYKSVLQMALRIHQPDLIIYDAGVDIHSDDELGYFNVSQEGIFQRDHDTLQLASELELPVACVVGGGYRSEHQDLVPIHSQLFKAALEIRKRHGT
ncbi:histone deacetylase family protein [Vibrio sonorensis]|uniref:histone deacetylase family protein n=1 Tax=Vibrio sonorensis TaxID=1004316 RepID=UPI0008D96E9E|nr:histone deacetylase [Vibrio sonorensis]